MQAGKVTIECANKIDLNISVDPTNKGYAVVVVNELRQKVRSNKGRIVLEQEYEDGFYFIIAFKSEMNLELFKKEYGL